MLFDWYFTELSNKVSFIFLPFILCTSYCTAACLEAPSSSSILEITKAGGLVCQNFLGIPLLHYSGFIFFDFVLKSSHSRLVWWQETEWNLLGLLCLVHSNTFVLDTFLAVQQFTFSRPNMFMFFSWIQMSDELRSPQNCKRWCAFVSPI